MSRSSDGCSGDPQSDTSEDLHGAKHPTTSDPAVGYVDREQAMRRTLRINYSIPAACATGMPEGQVREPDD